jgi:hypothetical protein
MKYVLAHMVHSGGEGKQTKHTHTRNIAKLQVSLHRKCLYFQQCKSHLPYSTVSSASLKYKTKVNIYILIIAALILC